MLTVCCTVTFDSFLLGSKIKLFFCASGKYFPLANILPEYPCKCSSSSKIHNIFMIKFVVFPSFMPSSHTMFEADTNLVEEFIISPPSALLAPWSLTYSLFEISFLKFGLQKQNKNVQQWCWHFISVTMWVVQQHIIVIINDNDNYILVTKYIFIKVRFCEVFFTSGRYNFF